MGAKERDASSIEIGGRTFVEIREGTIEHDLHFGKLVQTAGIDEIVREADEDAEDYARRMLEVLMGSGEILDLLAALMVPADLVADGQEAGDVWTLEIAGETRAFLAGLKSAEDKFRVRSLVVQLLLVFFERGIVSLWTSPKSSRGDGPAAGENESPPATASSSEIPDGSPGGGAGPTSSESSPEGITTSPPGSSAGPSGRP